MENKDYEIKMDGEFHTFEGGAVRYTKTGKGRFDLIPSDVVCEILNHVFLYDLHVIEYRCNAIASAFRGEYVMAIISIVNAQYTDSIIKDRSKILISKSDFLNGFARMLRDLAVHYEKGADKYGVDNWKRGIPISSFRDSGLRHLCQWVSGETDEPHHIAAIWNFFGLMWVTLHTDETEEKKEKEDETKDEDTKPQGGIQKMW